MFFKDTADFKKYFSVNYSFEFPELTVWLNHVDRTVLKKYLGSAFLAQLQAAFDAAATAAAVAAPLTQVVELIRVCTAPLTIAEWVPSGQVQMDNSGIRIASSEHFKTAFQWQVRDLEASLRQNGTSGLEDLLSYLHDNIASYATYSGSDEYKENKYLFVPSAKEFTKHFSPMNNSHVNFYKMKSIIRKIEDFDIKAILLPNYFNDLKTKLQSTTALLPVDKTIIDMIKPAVINLTIARAIDEMAASIDKNGFLVFDNTAGRETTEMKKQAGGDALVRLKHSCTVDGTQYLDNLKKYLEANTLLYTMYAADPLYTPFVSNNFDNQETNNFFYGG